MCPFFLDRRSTPSTVHRLFSCILILSTKHEAAAQFDVCVLYSRPTVDKRCPLQPAAATFSVSSSLMVAVVCTRNVVLLHVCAGDMHAAAILGDVCIF